MLLSKMPEPGKYITVFSSLGRCIVTLPSDALTDAAPIFGNSNRKQFNWTVGSGVICHDGPFASRTEPGDKGPFNATGEQILKQTRRALSADKKG